MSSTLQDLVNRAVFLSTEAQTHFGRLIADADWDVDFSRDPLLTFTSEGTVVLEARPHLLGSESSTQGTWLWGWENINEFPEVVVATSHEVRKFGASHDIAELTEAELQLDEELALRLTLASKEATDTWTHYPAAAGAGTTVWLLVDDPSLTLPEPTVRASVRALMQGLTQTTVTDHRVALESYVDKRDIPTVSLPDGGLRMVFSDGAADLSFDDQRRIANCQLQEPLEGEAAKQYAQAAAGEAITPSVRTEASSTPEEGIDKESSSSDQASVQTAKPTTATPKTNIPAEADAPTNESTDSAGAEDTADQAHTTTSADETAEDVIGSGTDEADKSNSISPEIKPQTQADEDESSRQTPAKKKGLFKKLFGR